jgi:transcriptional regulator with XRE-family HTH domain
VKEMNIDGMKVKIMLTQKNLSVRQFCIQNNLSYSTVIALINNSRAGNIRTIERIANALDVQVLEILKF